MSYQLIRNETRKARKPHRCIWCGEWINVGEKYERERGVYDGDMQNSDWHPECSAALSELVAAEGGEVEFDSHSNERPKSGEVSGSDAL